VKPITYLQSVGSAGVISSDN